MRFFHRFRNRGFTLVELMIVVAIIGVLAALAIYGVRRYLASAKTSEAKNTLGAISRGAVAAFEKGPTSQEVLTEGSSGTAQANDLCESAAPVPTNGTQIAGVKYQANTADNEDFELGSASSGWKCLRFTITSPIYFQYEYSANNRAGTGPGGAITGQFPGAATAPDPGFVATSTGDLDGDGTYSGFAQIGTVNTDTAQLKLATELEVTDEYE